MKWGQVQGLSAATVLEVRTQRGAREEQGDQLQLQEKDRRHSGGYVVVQWVLEGVDAAEDLCRVLGCGR